MRKLFLILGLLGMAFSISLGAGRYQYRVDLRKIKDDRLEVTLIPPESDQALVEFHFPKIVPGTYSIYDFGRFVKELSAIDKNGDPIKISKKDVNRWLIPNGKGISEIKYWVEDTYDYMGDTIVFEPGGTSFEEDELFLINTFGMFGYIQGKKRESFDLVFHHPEGFFAATPLKRLQSTGDMDRFFTSDYYELVDSPILYSRPDTSIIPLDNTLVQIAVYSPNKKVSSKDLKPEVKKILQAQRDYLGGNLPVDRYSILVFLQDQRSPSGGIGALEHSYSTLFSLPERDPASISQMITSITAHEFFHIITPLTIHSEQIHDFDFQNPKMSQNLWLYEGLTEYAGNHVQLKEGLISLDEFLRNMSYKIKRSKERFNDTLPFTVMSRGCLDEYKDEYFNVYEKGALIGLCLDVQLRKQSNGDYGTQELMRDLGKRYGIKKPFPDTEIFRIIGQMTSAETESFLEKYVNGTDALPLESTFESIGINYIEYREKEEITLGNIAIGFDSENDAWVVGGTKNMNEFGKSMGFKEKDILVSLNAKAIEGENFRTVVKEFKANTQVGEEVVVEILRPSKKGKYKAKKLNGTATKTLKTEKYLLEPLENPSQEQIQLRKAWGNI